MSTKRILEVRSRQHFKDGPPPLSLYVHFPWCLKKCPYCDFNSHGIASAADIPEDAYIDALIADLTAELPHIWGRRLISIFIGGGTPSLISAQGIDRLLSQIRTLLPGMPGLEITMEANPGTFEAERFSDYFHAGINRLSLGVQSFNDTHLKALGRIHDTHMAKHAIEQAQRIGFERLNVDIMFALPEQSIEESLLDLDTAISFGVRHLSWYQLTLEPNTAFYHAPPKLPSHDDAADIWAAGRARLSEANLMPYEISAYSQNDPCQHNTNYWQFGDYLGIGAGAHSKITNASTQRIHRSSKHRHPKAYLQADDKQQETLTIPVQELPFEFMLNVLRLKDGVPTSYFESRTGLPLSSIEAALNKGIANDWLHNTPSRIQATELGQQYLDNLVACFLEDSRD